MFRYNNVKITGAWQHDNGTKYPRGWIEGAEPQQLIDIGVETVPDIPYPTIDTNTQSATENPDGSYTITNLTQQQIDDLAFNKDVSQLQSAGKDMAVVLVELIDYLLANTAMTATDFTPNVRQAYQGIKAIADRVK